MYVAELKTTLRRAVYIICGVSLLNAFVVSSFLGWHQFPSMVAYQLIVSTCIGSSFWLTGPLIRMYCNRLSPVPRWTFRILCWAILLNMGVLVGLAVLSAIGAMQWDFYWQMFWMAFLPSTVISILFCVGLTMYETLKFRAQYETTQARLSSLESRLRPHFLFNTLNSILALIPEDPAAAERMTINLSALLRYSLDSSHTGTVSLDKELKIMVDYLEIEKMRFGSLQYSVDVPQDLMRTEVPPFCLQTLAENSVKYGGNEIRIRARNGGSRLVLSVWDSGSGFVEGGSPFKPGHGLDTLRGRLAALWGARASLEFPPSNEGTTVQLSIPAQGGQ
jgi:hypothetical protein